MFLLHTCGRGIPPYNCFQAANTEMIGRRIKNKQCKSVFWSYCMTYWEFFFVDSHMYYTIRQKSLLYRFYTACIAFSAPLVSSHPRKSQEYYVIQVEYQQQSFRLDHIWNHSTVFPSYYFTITYSNREVKQKREGTTAHSLAAVQLV